MFRNRTVDRLLAQSERRERELLRVVADQADRLMHLTGNTWTEPPAATLWRVDQNDLDRRHQDAVPVVLDPEQLPYSDLD